jgi:hypothetical protein
MNMLHPAERDNTHFSMQETVECSYGDELPRGACPKGLGGGQQGDGR